MATMKPWWQSKRFWGAALTLFSVIGLSGWGIEISDDATTLTIHLDTLAEKALAGGGVIGSLLHFWGAFAAKHKVGW